MLRFERTFDYRLVREIITHPAIWPWVTDDFAGAAEDFKATEHPGIWYVTAWDEAELLGMWCFGPRNGVCWEVHTYLLPECGFRRGREAARGMAAWIWDHTTCRRVITNVPAFHRAARIFALAAGMTAFGVNEKSFQKDGILHAQTMLGMSAPEE
jgi:hypothetical protein